MSFKTELVIEDKTYLLRRLIVNIDREIDSKGRPVSMPTWWIKLNIDSVDDSALTTWMTEPHKQMDGKITVYKIEEDSKMKEIEFKKSYCYRMCDSFKSDISYTSCKLMIAGKDISINSAELTQSWPG